MAIYPNGSAHPTPHAAGLYLADGSFQPFGRPFDAESLSIELATRRNAGVFGAMGSIGLWLDMLPDPDPVLRKLGQESAVLAELAADDQVTTAMLARKNRVLNCQHYGFRPGAPDGESPTPEAEELHRRFMADLERASLRSIISGILDAPFYGFSPLELLWEWVDSRGWWHLKDIIPRPQHWFRFDIENKPIFVGEYGGVLGGMGGATLGNGGPTPLPENKFVLVTHHATYENPYGLRLLSRCLWPVTFKRGGQQFYARFVEKFGQPWVLGKSVTNTAPEEKKAMAADLARMVQDCVAVVSAGAEVELLTSTTAPADIHERFLSRQDKSISKLLMGQTLTVEMEGQNNSQAAATTHGEVAESLADADKAMVVEAFNEIAWIYARINAGPDALAPIFAYEEPEDLDSRADLGKKLAEMGVEFTNKHFEEKYSLAPGEFTMRAAASPVQNPAVDFAAPPSLMPTLAEKAQHTLDAAIDTMLPGVRAANASFVSKLENAVGEANSFDELQLALVELLAPHVEPDALEDILARSMVAAAGFGATAVHGEGDS